MEHLTIDYGIDLGTTNSAICRMEKGVPVIIRSDNGMETMPSCVSFKKGGAVNVGYSAYSELGNSILRALKRNKAVASNSCIEFKRHMGTDRAFSDSYSGHAWTPEELSAKVISSLCSFVTDEEIKAAVITVPAKFTVNQKDATLEAAHLAGLDQVELLQEPIAASMAYGLKAGETKGIWMVFDFGGGTLDVALAHVSDGIMQVFDTEGDNYLGGKNLDEAIVSKILLPELLKRYVIDTTDQARMTLLTDALKVVAEKLKNALSYKDSETIYLEAGDWGEDEDGEEIEMELCISRSRLEEAMRPILQKAVDVCKNIMIRNDIPYGKLSHLILIGGPTYIPLLRKMLREQVTQNVETGIDPMTAVAKGAALYAATLPLKRTVPAGAKEDILQLDIDFESMTVDTESYVTVQNPGIPGEISIRLIRMADGEESAPACIGDKGGLIVADLLAGRPNTFLVKAAVDGVDTPCFPSEITIIQGIKAGSAILPYHIGIEVFNPKKGTRVFTSLTGLEKNRPLPAAGIVYGLKTPFDIAAGEEDVKFRIPIYQGDEGAEGKTAALYEYVSDVVISGDDLDSFVDEGSHVNVRIEVDRSEMMTVVAEFPATGQTVEKHLDTSRRQESKTHEYLVDLIARTNSHLRDLAANLDDCSEVLDLIRQLEEVKQTFVTGVQHKQVEQHLKEIMRQAEAFESESEWHRCRTSLQMALFSLQSTAASRLDQPRVEQMLESFTVQVDRVMQMKDVQRARYLQHQIKEYESSISQDEIYRNVINWAYNEFTKIKWTNCQKAQKLVLQAWQILQDNPRAPLYVIKPITDQFYSMIKHSGGDSSSRESASSSGRIVIPDILSI